MLERIGKYEVVSEIGKGGFGHVFKAYDKDVRRYVAIKVLSSVEDKDLVHRLSEEAAVVGRLNHKNIVTLYESGIVNGVPFLVMELLEGENLKDALEAGHSFSLLEKVRILNQVAEGLNSAHRAGIVHRDVKPANIMLLKDGTVKIMDFGISRLISADATHTKTGTLEGTIAYMSPEQFTGRSRVTRLTDIWSYGVIAYELISGMNPFFAQIPGQIIFKVTAEDQQPLRELVPDCPEALDWIIARCLNKEPQLRYSSLDDVRIDLEPIQFELERGEANRLVAEAREKLARKELPEADRLLKEAIELDRTNTDARALRSELRQQLWQEGIQARIAELRTRAGEEIVNRRLSEGVRLLEDAVKLDRSNAALKAELDQAQKQMENGRRALQLFAEGRQQHQVGNLPRAAELVSSAIALDPGLPDARQMLDAIERDQQEEVEKVLARARSLSASDHLQLAVQILQKACADWPQDVRLPAALREAEQSLREEEKRSLRTSIEQKIEARKLDLAAEDLSSALKEYPGDAAFEHLQSVLHAQQDQVELDSIIEVVRQFLGAHDLDSAGKTITAGLKRFPRSERLTLLQKEREEMSRQNAIAAAQAALKERPDDREALGILEHAKELHSDLNEPAPDSPELLQKAQALRAREFERFARRQELRLAIEAAIAEHNWDEAAKFLHEADKEFAREAAFLELRKFLQVQKTEFECNEAATAIRRLITDGSVELAGERLSAALNRFPNDRRIRQLHADLQSIEQNNKEIVSKRPDKAPVPGDSLKKWLWQAAAVLTVSLAVTGVYISLSKPKAKLPHQSPPVVQESVNTQVIRWAGTLDPGGELRISPDRRLTGPGTLDMKAKFPPIPLQVSVEERGVSVIAPSAANDFHIIIRNTGTRPVQNLTVRWTR